MLNIISRQIDNAEPSAVRKVGRNLVEGMKSIGYPFVLNKALDSCELLWIHDDYRALIGLERLDPQIKLVIGPNLFVMPRDIPRAIKIPERTIYLHPSLWAANAWKLMGYNRSKLDYWPVGIDTRDFPKRPDRTSGLDRVLFYYKDRDPPGARGAETIEALLQNRKIPYARINYGHYRQEDFLRQVSRSKYAIWYGRQESQGLALQETLAMGCPIIVIEVSKIGDYNGGGYRLTPRELAIPASSAPYFDDRCGLKLKAISELDTAIDKMEKEYSAYDPKSFIAENLSLEMSARNLLSKFGVQWPQGSKATMPESADFKPFVPHIAWVITALELRFRQRGIRGLLSR